MDLWSARNPLAGNMTAMRRLIAPWSTAPSQPHPLRRRDCLDPVSVSRLTWHTNSERLQKQNGIEHEDHGGPRDCARLHQRAVDEPAHDVASRGEHHKSNHWNR